MSKVFVTQFMRNIDYGEAEKFGELVFITKGDFRPAPTMPSANKEVADDIMIALSEVYIPDNDYLLVAPNNVVNIYVGSQLGKGRHNILKWDNKNHTYRVYDLLIN